MGSTEIPKLPGYTVSAPIVPPKKGFGRSQSLHYNNGFAIERPIENTDEPIETVPAASAENTTNTCFENGKVKLPKWVEMDRKVLRFYGYFVEYVVESPIEDHRIRKVRIYYYLSDDTIHVEEPKQDNSGLTQGIFVKRHKIKKTDGRPLLLTDIRVGEELMIYGRSIQIVDCDGYTREYLKATVGYDVPAALPYPVDPIDVYRDSRKKTDASIPPNPRNDSLTRYLEAKLGKPSNVLEKDTLKKYLDNNRTVLRFWCFWDDRRSLYGQRRPYALHYFLEDDTGEILECFETNSGRAPFPVFQKRGPLIKGFSGFAALGESLKHRQLYEPVDFRIGASLLLNNRRFFIYDCDAFTRNWYKKTFGTTDEELAPIDITEGESVLPQPSLPPHNGFGSQEDSKQNCVMLVPKPPKKDFLKLMNKDQIVLRFSAKLYPTERFRPSGDDAARTFVVTYFMADDTIAIFEKPLKNSGLVGGKFLERAKIRKPDSNEPYTYHDLFVGALVDFHRRGFLLIEADEYTYTYMENNKHVFTVADSDAAIVELRSQSRDRQSEMKSSLMESTVDGKLTADKLEPALRSAGIDLIRHQIVALERKLEREYESGVDIDAFLELLEIAE